MWKFAEVEILSTKQKLIVETQFIEKFEKYSQATKNKVYLLRQLGKSERCLILKTANSMEEINNPRLRSRRPKAHISSLEEKSDDSDDSIDLVMRKRKAKGQNQIQAKNKESQDILTKYEEQRKKDNNLHGEAHERVEEENDGSHEEVDDDDDDDDVENERENGNRIVDVVIEHAESHNESETNMGTENDRETPDDDLFDTQVSINPINLEGDATDQVQSPRVHNNTKRRNVTDRSNEELRNNELNLRMEQLIKQNRKLNEIIHIMRHEQRSDSRNQCLERERELIELHRKRKLQERAQKEREEVEQEQQKQEQQERQQRERERREQEQRDQQQRDREQRERERRERERRERERRERGNQTDDEQNDITDQVPIGGQIFISSLAYTEAFREYRPSKFITIMSHAIWGYNNLALRAVKVGKRNAEKLPLTPAKKLVLEKQYKKFLRQRNLSADMETMERNKINTYLGRSITSATKKIANT